MFDELQQLSQSFLSIKDSSYRRYFIKSTPLDARFTILLGQRGIGKTTTLIQYLLDQSQQDQFSKKILYIQADHFLMGTTSLYDIAEQHTMLGGEIIGFDEVHKYTNWSQELKSIYDTFPKLKIIASGSSALEIHRGSHDLSRRAIIYKMYGLSFREYLELELNMNLPSYSLKSLLDNHVKISTKIINSINSCQKKIIPLFKNYLESGYYPYYREFTNKEHYAITLEQNIHTTLESDMVAINPELTGHTIKKIKQLLIAISSMVPFTPNWSNIRNILNVGDTRTIKKYFQYLEGAGLIQTMLTGSKKLNVLETPEKVYLDNPNQMHAICTITPNIGTIRETFFLDMLKVEHQIALPKKGDFLVEDSYVFEIGGRNKDNKQIKGIKNGYLACDDIEIGINNKIPLWLFGFLY